MAHDNTQFNDSVRTLLSGLDGDSTFIEFDHIKR